MVSKYPNKKRKTYPQKSGGTGGGPGAAGDRRLQKSKYGRGKYKVRSAIRSYVQRNLVVPRHAFAPDRTFIKIRISENVSLSNTSPNYIKDYPIKGNSIYDYLPGSTYTVEPVGAPLYQYAQLYRKLYIYKSAISVTIAPVGDYTSSGAYTFWTSVITPNTTVTELDITTVNWDGGSSGGISPTDFPYATYQEWLPGRALFPIKLKNKATTKKMFEKNTKTDDDFIAKCSSQLGTGSIGSSDPTNVWYWHLFTIDNAKGGTTGSIAFRMMYKITWYAMLFERETDLRHRDVVTI